MSIDPKPQGGVLFGTVFPPRPLPGVAQVSLDGRTVALRTLKQYLTDLTFFRAGNSAGTPVAFKVKPEHFFIEWPDNEEDMAFPSIACRAGKGDHLAASFTPIIDEASYNVFGPGTVLKRVAEVQETVQLEVWCSTKAERRGISASIDTVFSPVEGITGARFILHDYFEQTVMFTLMSTQIIDDEDAVRNRRRFTIDLEMRFDAVELVNVNTLQPSTQNYADGEPLCRKPVCGRHTGR